MTVPLPSATLQPLHRADGSATYSHSNYTILGSVNGPIEVQRREEIPEEAAIEVIVRPSVGVGSPRERALEAQIHSLLRSVILVRKYPRSLIQVTLQILSQPADSEESLKPTASTSPLPLLPHLLQTALLTLLAASIPLATTFTSTLIATSPGSAPIAAPTPAQIRSSTALHVFSFSSKGRNLLSDSAGTFTMADYEAAYALAASTCAEPTREENAMDVEGGTEGRGLGAFVRGVVREKVEAEQRWRAG